MLGKLFNLGSGPSPGAAAPGQAGSSKPTSSLESVQEDIHTRNLLFPDANILYQHRSDQLFPLPTGPALPPASPANAFDYDGELDLESRDVRIIIMQDALSSVTASLLYDSQAPPTAPPSVADRPSTTAGTSHFSLADQRRTTISARKSSLSHASRPLIIQPDSPQLRLSAFDRRGSVQGRSQASETESQRAWREYRDELTTFSSCIFGNSELMAYKGTSTKVHIVPTDSRLSDYPSAFLGDGRGSVGRSSVRSSRLAQSYSSENIPPFHSPTSSGHSSRLLERRKILITRLFPVSLPTDDDVVVTPQSRLSEDNSGYPFPPSGDEFKFKRKKPQPKQKRTPMYAVALIVNLPPAVSHATSTGAAKPAGSHGPGSYTEQDSFPSSFGSARRSGWTMVDRGAGVDPLDNMFTSDIEDRMDAITQRWDVIMRTLTHLQSIVATTLYAMLKQADITSPDPFPASVSSQIARTPSLSGRRSEDGASIKPPKTNAKLISLLPNCLAEDRQIKTEVEIARTRIVTGLRAIRVVTGQNRWGIWREEARWVAKWGAGRDQDPFFFNLLTGFLATHVEWLQALSPPWYRKRYFAQQKAKGEEDTSVPARTVIVAQDKMAARRILFLLSAFLPTNQPIGNVRAHRPSTSASLGGLSQSPPSYVVPILKEESLRRKLNRRTGAQRASHSRNLSFQGHTGRPAGVTFPAAQLGMEAHHSRRPSDPSSIRTADLPFPGSDPAARKSSAATTATITPETTATHFSAAHRLDSFRSTRPGSSSSVAADDLKRSLTRGESTGHFSSTSSSDSRQSSRWGSVISGFLNPRRRESTNTTVQSRGSISNRGNPPPSPTKLAESRVEPPHKIVKEAQMVESPVGDQLNPIGGEARDDAKASSTPHQPIGEQSSVAEATGLPQRPKKVPAPPGAFESPVKTSINLDDGVIDVDVTFPEYITSFETAVSSPSSSGYLSTPGFGSGLDAFEQSCRVSVDGDTPLNVAGWLPQFHPDFVLQAIPPQDGLAETIKDALRAEPSPGLLTNTMSADPHLERWMDVSSAIIADTATFTISRIRYRRLVRPKPSVDRGGPLLLGSVNAYSSVLLTPAISPYEMQLEEEFIEEPIASLDEVLIDAVERVLALSHSNTTVAATTTTTTDANLGPESSECSSRSTSKRRERSDSVSSQRSSGDVDTQAPGQPRIPDALTEVPRAKCKTVVLSALEEIVREVIESRETEGSEGHDGGGSSGREKESSLRGAVRAWLESVELGE